MNDLVNWPLLLRYLAGECSPSEQVRVATWVDEDPERRAYVDSLRDIEMRFGHRAAGFDKTAARSRLWNRLDLDPSVPSAASRAPVDTTVEPDRQSGRPSLLRKIEQLDPEERGTRPHTFFFRKSFGVGRLPHTWPRGAGGDAWHVRAVTASAVVALGVGLCIGIMRHHAGLSTAAEREYATAAGQRLSVTLVDGTRFTLAPASRVRVAADYGRPTGVRSIELEGEAYFAVMHDAAHPFAVHTRTVMAQDVGTAFDVRAYPEDGGARIVVADGVVAVHTAGACRPRPQRAGARGDACGTRVQVGDVATVTNGSVAVKHGADIATLTAWMQGGLVFRNTPLGEVMREVARTFDLRITIADSEVVNQLVTAAFGPESADEILDEVTAVVGARYERIGQRVVIRHRAGGVGGQQVPGSQGPTPLQTARRGDSHE